MYAHQPPSLRNEAQDILTRSLLNATYKRPGTEGAAIPLAPDRTGPYRLDSERRPDTSFAALPAETRAFTGPVPQPPPAKASRQKRLVAPPPLDHDASMRLQVPPGTSASKSQRSTHNAH